jgi:hypothetical protein
VYDGAQGDAGCMWSSGPIGAILPKTERIALSAISIVVCRESRLGEITTDEAVVEQVSDRKINHADSLPRPHASWT